MVLDGVHRQADQLDAALVELGLQVGRLAELGGADGGEVLGMAEQHGPARTEPVVKTDPAVRGVLFEVGGGLAQLNAHGHSSVMGDLMRPGLFLWQTNVILI